MPTATLVTVIAGFVTLVLAIFGASWLNQRAIERALDRQTDRIMKYVDARFAAIESRIDRIERQLEAILKPVKPVLPK